MKKGLLATFATLLCVLTCALGLAACDDGSQTTTTTDPVAVENVTLSKTTLTLDVGDEETLTATVTPNNATDKTVTWTTSDAAIATVNDGTVKAVAAGSATITAKAGEKSATCTVTVAQPLTYTVTLSKTTLTLDVGDEETLTATVTPNNATDKTVTWTTSDAAIATVNDGTVKAVAAGSATITAKAGEKSATCTVTVAQPLTYTVTSAEWDAAIEGILSPKNMTMALSSKMGATTEYQQMQAFKFDWAHKAIFGVNSGETAYLVYENDTEYQFTQGSDGKWYKAPTSAFESAEDAFETTAQETLGGLSDLIGKFSSFEFDAATNTYVNKNEMETRISFQNGKLMMFEGTDAENEQAIKFTFSDYGTTEVIPPADYEDASTPSGGSESDPTNPNEGHVDPPAADDNVTE